MTIAIPIIILFDNTYQHNGCIQNDIVINTCARILHTHKKKYYYIIKCVYMITMIFFFIRK